jgi:hypothetical protein
MHLCPLVGRSHLLVTLPDDLALTRINLIGILTSGGWRGLGWTDELEWTLYESGFDYVCFGGDLKVKFETNQGAVMGCSEERAKFEAFADPHNSIA